MKQNHQQVREVKQALHPSWGVWEARGDLDGTLVQYYSPDWEPVPETRWVDVTEQCYAEYCGTRVADRIAAKVVVEVTKGYRLKKRDLWTPEHHPQLHSSVQAFIIEQEQSDRSDTSGD